MNKTRIKSNKGVTMLSLIIYVASFLSVTIVIGYITTFFYNNIVTINTDLGSNAYYNAFNSAMLTEVKKPGVQVKKINTNYTNSGKKFKFLTLKNNDTVNAFVYDINNHILYYNYTALCKNVENFEINKVDDASGKTVLNTLITIGNTAYRTNYVLRNN